MKMVADKTGLSSEDEAKLKKCNGYVTLPQKKAILTFIRNNLEMITHSSTEENEESLWGDLKCELDRIGPKKTLNGWKKSLARWRVSVFSKPETKLLTIDQELKTFLIRVMKGDINGHTPQYDKKIKPGPRKVTIEHIDREITEIDKERSNLTAEIDITHDKIYSQELIIRTLKDRISLKRERLKKLSERKASLNFKKRKLLEDSKATDSDEIDKLKES